MSVTVYYRVESDEYPDYVLSVEFYVPDEYLVSVGGIAVESRDYNGLPVEPQGKPVFTNADGVTVTLPYELAYTDGDGYPLSGAPVGAGEYALEVVLEDPYHTGTTGFFPFTIYQAPVTMTPDDVALTVGDAIPGSFAVRCEGLVDGDGLSLFDPQPLVEMANAISTGSAGSTPLVIVNDPQADNYKVRKSTGMLTVSGNGVDPPPEPSEGSYLVYDAPNEHGWHRAEITVRASGADGFTVVSLPEYGFFANSITLYGQTASGSATVEVGRPLGDGTYDVLTEVFNYQMDKTSPYIRSITFEQIESTHTGILTIMPEDELSGVASVEVTTPSGRAVGGNGWVYFVEEDGLYRIVVTDYAGNQMVMDKQVTIDRTVLATSSSSSRSGSGKFVSAVTSDGDTAELYWQRVVRSLELAEAGTAVRVEMGSYTSVPAAVLRAIQGRAVTLRIIPASGERIDLYGSNLPKLDASVSHYTLSQLREMAQYVRTDRLAPSADAETPVPTKVVTVAQTAGDGSSSGARIVVEEDLVDAASWEDDAAFRYDTAAYPYTLPFVYEPEPQQSSTGFAGRALTALFCTGGAALVGTSLYPYVRAEIGKRKKLAQQEEPET